MAAVDVSAQGVRRGANNIQDASIRLINMIVDSVRLICSACMINTTQNAEDAIQLIINARMT
jgi:hypothetical protein